MTADTVRLLRRAEVESITGLSRSALYRAMRAGTFPIPVSVGGHAVRWRSNEVVAWVDSRPRAEGDK